MRASQMKSLLAIAAAMGAGAAGAGGWEPVVKMNGQSVDVDTARVGKLADGRATAWTRLALDRDYIDETGLRYTTVEALNRYDCEKHTFTTLKRAFVRDGKLIRREVVGTPREMNAEPGTPDDKLLNQVCKTAVGQASPDKGLPIADMKPTVIYADVRSAEAATGKSAQPADKGADAKKAEKPADKPAADSSASGERPRFIDLPKIDKSKIEDPNATAKAPEAKDAKDSKSAAKSAAEKTDKMAKTAERPKAPTPERLPSYRAELERLYASSGPRRAPAPKAKKPAPEPVAEPVTPPREIHWSYEGEGAPANWGKLRPEYATCASGKRQSPIDIRDTIRVDLEPINFEYRLSHFSISDTGHTIQVNVGEGSSIRVMEHIYQLVQFHFHKPAGERINGRMYDMAVHLVHRDEAGQFAVIAVPLEKGPEHPLIQAIWNNLPLDRDHDVAPSWFIDPNLLLPPPENRAYFTYMGSRTTPPCAEDVLWMVFKQPIAVSPQQIGIFSHLYMNNARPVQPSNGRLIKENR